MEVGVDWIFCLKMSLIYCFRSKTSVTTKMRHAFTDNHIVILLQEHNDSQFGSVEPGKFVRNFKRYEIT